MLSSTSGQEEFLAVIRKSQEAVIAAVANLAETVRTASPKLASAYAPLTENLPKPPSVSVPFADKLPGPEEAVASAYGFAEGLLASQRKFAEDLLQAAAPSAPGRAESAPVTETYKPGQIVPRDGTVECGRHRDVQNHVQAGTRFAPCSHHHEHSEGCTWQYI
jgi:hypothetical protein